MGVLRGGGLSWEEQEYPSPRHSPAALQAWLTEIHEYAQKDVVIMLLGNKVRAGPLSTLCRAVPCRATRTAVQGWGSSCTLGRALLLSGLSQARG